MRRCEEVLKSQNHAPGIYVRTLPAREIPKPGEGQESVDFSCSDPFFGIDSLLVSFGHRPVPSFSRSCPAPSLSIPTRVSSWIIGGTTVRPTGFDHRLYFIDGRDFVTKGSSVYLRRGLSDAR